MPAGYFKRCGRNISGEDNAGKWLFVMGYTLFDIGRERYVNLLTNNQ